MEKYRKVFRVYIDGKIKLEPYQKFGVFALVVAAAGLIGWIYETIFYFFNDGFKFSMQGGNFLPWINIYAIGALFIILTTYKLRKKPWLVFLVSMLVTGLVEYIGGWLVYTIGNGTRFWDYNVEALNFGNINGFICLRSVLCFGLSALFLMYAVLPFFIYLAKKMTKRAFMILTITIFSVVIIDEFYNLLATYFLNIPNAREIYYSIGLYKS